MDNVFWFLFVWGWGIFFIAIFGLWMAGAFDNLIKKLVNR